jgi:hypothetical protein
MGFLRVYDPADIQLERNGVVFFHGSQPTQQRALLLNRKHSQGKS